MLLALSGARLGARGEAASAHADATNATCRLRVRWIGKEEESENPGEDVAKVLRTQMQKIREISQTDRFRSVQSENTENSADAAIPITSPPTTSNQSDVYAAHLNKLLRLAEEAISGNE